MDSDGLRSPASTASPILLSNDTTYFLTSIFFQVEDTLFKVPRYHFERNEVFAIAFKLPPPTGQQPEGSSETTPIKLEFVSKVDFQAFLGVLYPLTVPPRYKDISTEEWKSILKLSAMWTFDSVRELAIRELTASNRLDAVSKILLGIEHDVEQWLVSGCNHFIVRNSGPRAEEAKLLGEDITAMIWDMRELRIWSSVRREYAFDTKGHVKKAFSGRITFDS